jgi:hypothetical protein
MTKGIYHQATRLLTKEGNLDHHSMIIQRLLNALDSCHAAKNLHARRSEKLQEQLAAKDSLNSDLMANCNQLRDRCWMAESELAGWQKIAIDERARRIISMEPEAKFDRYDLQECPRIGYICDENDGYCVLSECPSRTFWEQIAAKELQLEADSMQSEELAHVTLDRIRDGA